MNENYPDQSLNDGEDSHDSAQTEPVVWGPPEGAPMKQRVRWYLSRAIAILGSFLLLGSLFTGTAAWYTSRPSFCRSCHIMEPYYDSWQHSSHKDVSCVKCHFPPGVGEKIRGKMQGLVQLTTYITQSQGPRPAAEIPDASCLRSGCHETRLLSGKIDYNGIPFDHGPHLSKIRRGKQLRCTSCHSQIVQGSHMTVTKSTCALCHFKDGRFNEGLGACTRCHAIPDKEFDLGGGVKFRHELAFEQNADCKSCHSDLIRGNGEVPKERCGVCHNREGDLERIKDTDFLHEKHISEHKVDCLDCHLEIQHSLDPDILTHAASDCASCHPNHHHQQVAMMKGTGGESIPHQSSGMSNVRIACKTCHVSEDYSPTGVVLLKASMRTCTVCHAEEQVEELNAYHELLKQAISKLGESSEQVRKAIGAAKLDAGEKKLMNDQLKLILHDVTFMQTANNIHNMHYSHALAEAVVEQLNNMCGKLKIEPPKVKLPERISVIVGQQNRLTNETPAAEVETPKAAGKETPEATDKEVPKAAGKEETPPEKSTEK